MFAFETFIFSNNIFEGRKDKYKFWYICFVLSLVLFLCERRIKNVCRQSKKYTLKAETAATELFLSTEQNILHTAALTAATAEKAEI